MRAKSIPQRALPCVNAGNREHVFWFFGRTPVSLREEREAYRQQRREARRAKRARERRKVSLRESKTNASSRASVARSAAGVEEVAEASNDVLIDGVGAEFGRGTAASERPRRNTFQRTAVTAVEEGDTIKNQTSAVPARADSSTGPAVDDSIADNDNGNRNEQNTAFVHVHPLLVLDERDPAAKPESLSGHAVELTDLQAHITDAILNYADDCGGAPLDDVHAYVKERWRTIRRRDGSAYTTDCRRAILANLRFNAAAGVQLFIKSGENLDGHDSCWRPCRDWGEATTAPDHSAKRDSRKRGIETSPARRSSRMAKCSGSSNADSVSSSSESSDDARKSRRPVRVQDAMSNPYAAVVLQLIERCIEENEGSCPLEIMCLFVGTHFEARARELDVSGGESVSLTKIAPNSDASAFVLALLTNNTRRPGPVSLEIAGQVYNVPTFRRDTRPGRMGWWRVVPGSPTLKRSASTSSSDDDTSDSETEKNGKTPNDGGANTESSKNMQSNQSDAPSSNDRMSTRKPDQLTNALVDSDDDKHALGSVSDASLNSSSSSSSDEGTSFKDFRSDPTDMQVCVWRAVAERGKSNPHATMTEDEMIEATLPYVPHIRTKSGAAFVTTDANGTLSDHVLRDACVKEVRASLLRNPPTRPFLTTQRIKANSGSHCVIQYGLAPRSREWLRKYGKPRLARIDRRKRAVAAPGSRKSSDDTRRSSPDPKRPKYSRATRPRRSSKQHHTNSHSVSSSESTDSSSSDDSDDSDRGEDGMYGITPQFVRNLFSLRSRRRSVSRDAWWSTPERLILATQGPDAAYSSDSSSTLDNDTTSTTHARSHKRSSTGTSGMSGRPLQKRRRRHS